MITTIKIFENLQLADKIYFKTNILTEEDKLRILEFTNGDYTTKFIADMYNKTDYYTDIESLKDIHNQLINYNKNILPIPDFNINNANNSFHYFKLRKDCLTIIEKLPSIAKRNMKEIRQQMTEKELYNFHHLLEYFSSNYALLSNRSKDILDKINKKLFKSNITIDELINFVEDKYLLLEGDKITKDDVLNIVKEDRDENMDIIYDTDNIIVIRVYDYPGIKKIGRNSLWCFTYGERNHHDWNNNTTNGICYVICNFNLDYRDENYMTVLTKPLNLKYDIDNSEHTPLYTQTNDNIDNPHYYLKSIFKKYNYKKLFNFEL